MPKEPFKARTLSALVFCLGASQMAAASSGPAGADDVKVQALKLLNENRISYDEFRRLVAEPELSTAIESNFVSNGNYASFISQGNYASFISEANYANFLSAGNYASFVSEANYGSQAQGTEKLKDLPAPQVEVSK